MDGWMYELTGNSGTTELPVGKGEREPGMLKACRRLPMFTVEWTSNGAVDA